MLIKVEDLGEASLGARGKRTSGTEITLQFQQGFFYHNSHITDQLTFLIKGKTSTFLCLKQQSYSMYEDIYIKSM